MLRMRVPACAAIVMFLVIGCGPEEPAVLDSQSAVSPSSEALQNCAARRGRLVRDELALRAIRSMLAGSVGGSDTTWAQEWRILANPNATSEVGQAGHCLALDAEGRGVLVYHRLEEGRFDCYEHSSAVLARGKVVVVQGRKEERDVLVLDDGSGTGPIELRIEFRADGGADLIFGEAPLTTETRERLVALR